MSLSLIIYIYLKTQDTISCSGGFSGLTDNISSPLSLVFYLLCILFAIESCSVSFSNHVETVNKVRVSNLLNFFFEKLIIYFWDLDFDLQPAQQSAYLPMINYYICGIKPFSLIKKEKENYMETVSSILDIRS
jgi:hypothetical protein